MHVSRKLRERVPQIPEPNPYYPPEKSVFDTQGKYGPSRYELDPCYPPYSDVLQLAKVELQTEVIKVLPRRKKLKKSIHKSISTIEQLEKQESTVISMNKRLCEILDKLQKINEHSIEVNILYLTIPHLVEAIEKKHNDLCRQANILEESNTNKEKLRTNLDKFIRYYWSQAEYFAIKFKN